MALFLFSSLPPRGFEGTTLCKTDSNKTKETGKSYFVPLSVAAIARRRLISASIDVCATLLRPFPFATVENERRRNCHHFSARDFHRDYNWSTSDNLPWRKVINYRR